MHLLVVCIIITTQHKNINSKKRTLADISI